MVVKVLEHSNHGESGQRFFKETQIKGRNRLIDTSGNVWRIGEESNISINFDLLTLDNPYLIDQLKYYLSDRLKSLSPITVSTQFETIYRFLNTCAEIDDIAFGEELRDALIDEMQRYYITMRNSRDEDQLGKLRLWYCKSELLGLPAFDEFLALHLKGMKLKGSTKGLDVRIKMDGRGALSTDEFLRFKKLLNDYSGVYSPGTASYWKQVSTWIYIVLGIRPEQMLLLMDEDYYAKISQKGSEIHILNVPSVKKHYSLPRTYFKKRPIPSFLGRMIEALIASNKQRAEEIGLQFTSLPIFMSFTDKRIESGLTGASVYRFSQVSIQLSVKDLLRTLNKEEIKCGAKALDINLNPRRLRKTFASQAAAQGVSARVLAELLDHEDLQYVMVYYEMSPEFARKLDIVYKDSFGELFEYFKGNITLETVVKAHKEQVIYGPNNLRELIEIGYCGSDQRCSLAPPYSCYGCDKLQACDNKSVHEVVLKGMKDEVDELFKHKVKPAKYNAEHILACEQLIVQLGKKG